MKRICLFLLTLAPLFAFSQLIDELPKSKSGDFFLSQTISSDKSKSDLYLFAKQFLIDKTSSDILGINDAAKMDDKESGILIKKGYLQLDMRYYRLYYTLKINVSENELKYELYDFYYYNENAKRTFPVDYFLSTEKYFKRNGSAKAHNERIKQATFKAIDDFNLSITKQLSN